MAKGRKNEDDLPAHQHTWIKTRQESERKCADAKCRYILVSRKEYEHRIDAWNSYFELVSTTPAYLDFLEMKQAFKSKNIEQIKEIKQKIMIRGEWGENEYGEKSWILKNPLDKPDFPDPSTWSFYIIHVPKVEQLSV